MPDIILRPVDRVVIVKDGQDETPFNKRTWEASYDWEPGKRSEDFRWLRGHGDTQDRAIAALLQETERVQP